MDLSEKTQNENRHPWELSRARCVLNVVKRYNLKSLADIGAGDRFFTSLLRPFIAGTLYAVDAGYEAGEDMIDGICCLDDISGLSRFDGKCGLVLMDVLEHIEDDAAFLGEALLKIPIGGYVFITVPAHQFLFSAHDVFLKHYRRYSRKQLLALVRSQNLHIEKSHYFYASLFFARLLSLPFGKRKKQAGIGRWRFGEKRLVTKVIYTVLNIDFFICGLLSRLHIHLPGLSLLAVCRK